MKKTMMVIVSLVAILLVILRGFEFFNAKGILKNEAVFELYLDLNHQEIEAVFNLKPDSYNPEKHQIICKLPVEVEGIKSGYRLVENKVSLINCKEKYNKKKHIKYSPYELKEGGAKLILMQKTSHSLALFSEKLSANYILAARPIYIQYKKGKINHLVISKKGINLFCKS